VGSIWGAEVYRKEVRKQGTRNKTSKRWGVEGKNLSTEGVFEKEFEGWGGGQTPPTTVPWKIPGGALDRKKKSVASRQKIKRGGLKVKIIRRGR